MAGHRIGLRGLMVAGLLASILSLVLLLGYMPTTRVAPEQMRRVAGAAQRWKRRALDAVNNTRAALNCQDNDSSCQDWARSGECERNAAFMNTSCARACNLCEGLSLSRLTTSWKPKPGVSCEDRSSFCGQWAAVGECDSNPNYMRTQCPVTCHLCQSAKCHDEDEARCAREAATGQCRAEPDRMYRECRWSCKWCAMETGTRCRRQTGERPAARKGTLEYMFRRSTSSPFAPRVLSTSPWIVTFDNFLSADEADRIIQVGGRGWQRSQAGDGVQAVRTSSTAWCDAHHCQKDPVLTRVRERIANLTLVPEQNAEYMQVLKYETGQFYKPHHDQNSPMTSAWGPRMYTFFMYLNDDNQGGETRFTKLNISVRPKRGRALLWPSVLDHDPNERDDRTEHEAVTVSGGTKFAANYWLHMYDFQYAVDRGCGNTEVFGNW